MADYASSIIGEEIDILVAKRDQLIRQQADYKTSANETLAQLDATIVEIGTGIGLLDREVDADAIAVLEDRLAHLTREQNALLDLIADYQSRDTAAQIAALDRRIAALEASLRKVPLREEK